MDFETTLHWLYVAAMAVGAIVFFFMSRNPRGVPLYEYSIAMFIPIWSGAAYLAMALNQGSIAVDNQITYYARYLDWVVTTPLLLLSLSFTAMFSVEKKKTLIFGLIAADVFMIVTGLIADLSPSPLRYVWYVLGVGAFMAVLYMVWVPLKAIAESQGPELGRVFVRVAGMLTALWFCYPLTWILGPSGIGLLSQEIDTLLFTLVPIVSKVGWSLVDLTSLRSLVQSGAIKPGDKPIPAGVVRA